MLHGRHGSCAGTPANPLRYPCTDAQTEIPSYLGYDGAGDALAALGYVVVSVSANAINANDNQLAFDYGATARGQLVLDHIDYLAAANTGSVDQLGEALVGRIDLSAIGLMGHSRGGDGVVRAALLNQNLPEPYSIVSVLPLAPVDFGRLTLPEIPMMTILPYCDGDVTNLQGQHFIDDSRAIFGDDVLRSAVLAMGTDHNFYNTIWTPGGFPYSASDDWGNRLNSVCGTDPSVAETTTRLPAADQYALGTALITAWFRLTVGEETEFLPLFDGSGATTTAMRDMGATIVTTASGPASSTTMVNSFETPSNTVRALGGASAVYCASMSGAPAPYGTPVCASTLSSAQAPHWAQMRFAPSAPATPVVHFTWPARTATQTPSTLRVDVPASARDVSHREALTLRAAPTALATAPAHMTITLHDQAGATATVATADYSTAPEPLPFNTVSGNGSTNVHKTILRQVYIPVRDITGIDLTRLARIDFAPQVGSEPGGVYLSDLAFTDSAVGSASVPTSLPRLSMGNTYVNEGAGPGTALIAAHLDRPAPMPVTGYFEVIGAETGLAQNSARAFTIPAGQVCAAFDVPMSGNRTTSASATTAYTVTASVVGGASTAEAFGRLTVREDDAVVDASGIVQEMAPEPVDTGDPCGDPLPTVATRVVVDPQVSIEEGAGGPVSAEVIALATGGLVPDGVLSVSLGGAGLATVGLASDGTAEFDIPRTVTPGVYTLTVDYPGTATYLPSATAISLTVLPSAQPAPTVTETVPGPVVTRTVPGPRTTETAPGATLTVSVPGPTVTEEVPVSGPTVTASSPPNQVSVPGPTVTVTSAAPTPAAVDSNLVVEALTGVGTDVGTSAVKAAPTGKFTVSARRVKAGARPTVKGSLTVGGSAATGKVLVLVDKKVRKTVTLKRGSLTWTLPKLGVGRHTVNLVYLGSQRAMSKTFKAGTLRVTR
jgi:hypothetical protein